jgi:A118 family predicted phage portal protein
LSIADRVKSLLFRGGAKVGVVSSLGKVTDHPRISVNASDYDRIAEWLKYFEGEFPQVEYKNTYGYLKKRDYVGLNMAKKVASRMSSVLFNEQMNFAIENNDTAQEFIQEVFQENDFMTNFEEYLENCMALGGLAMRPSIYGGKVSIDYIQAPVFYPLKSNTKMINECAITFKTVKSVGSKKVYYTLLEFHEWIDGKYRITNELYRSENNIQVGIRCNLSDLYDDLEPEAYIDNLTRPLFVYLKPFGSNNKDIESPLGISIYANALGTLKKINDTHDQYEMEFRLGQRKIAVPESMLRSRPDRKGHIKQYFDSDQNVFVALGGDLEEAKVQDLTSEIRASAYIDSIGFDLKLLEMQVGLSSGTFSFGATGLKTATEVVSENSTTYQTRNSHISNVDRAIKELMISIIELAKAYDVYSGEAIKFDDINIDFDDGVFLDKNSELDYYSKAVGAGLMSQEYAIEHLFNLDDKGVATMMAQIGVSKAPTDPTAALFGDE